MASALDPLRSLNGPVLVLRHLRDTVSYLNIRSHKRSATELKRWTWLDRWHDQLADDVWVEQSAGREALARRWQRSTADEETLGLMMRTLRERLYFGVPHSTHDLINKPRKRISRHQLPLHERGLKL